MDLNTYKHTDIKTRDAGVRVLENLGGLKLYSNSTFFNAIQRDHTRHFEDSELTNQQGWMKSNTNTPA